MRSLVAAVAGLALVAVGVMILVHDARGGTSVSWIAYTPLSDPDEIDLGGSVLMSPTRLAAGAGLGGVGLLVLGYVAGLRTRRTASAGT